MVFGSRIGLACNRMDCALFPGGRQGIGLWQPKTLEFYEPILRLEAKKTGEDYAEFPTGVGVLAIFSGDAQERYIPGSAEAAKNESVVLQFRVGDVDQEYRRLQGLVKTWVKPPTTQPWGTRSVYFRDPDGNLVDFYAPVKG